MAPQVLTGLVSELLFAIFESHCSIAAKSQLEDARFTANASSVVNRQDGLRQDHKVYLQYVDNDTDLSYRVSAMIVLKMTGLNA